MVEDRSLELASIPRRFLANLLDWLVFGSLFFAYARLVGAPGAEGEYLVEGVLAIPVLAAWWLYFAVPEAIFGQTLGKWLFDLQVRSANGQRAQVDQVLKRRLCDLVDFGLSLGIVALVMAKRLPYQQRFGDFVAGTVVVRAQS